MVTTGLDGADSWVVGDLFVSIRKRFSNTFLSKYQGDHTVNHLILFHPKYFEVILVKDFFADIASVDNHVMPGKVSTLLPL